jgi:transposase-like protein
MSAPKHITSQQELVLALLSAGQKISDAAESVGVHRNTVGNWLRSSQQFRDGLSFAQYNQALFCRERAEELVDDAWFEIKYLLNDTDASPAVRLKAATFIIQYASAPLPALPAGLPEMMPGYDLYPPKTHTGAQPEPAPEPEKPAALAPAPEPIAEKKPAPAQSCTNKIGRNEPCPCGSGLKFKRCHLGKPLPDTPATVAA